VRKMKELRCSGEPRTVGKPLRIVIPFTSHDLARAEFQAALDMAGDLDAMITLAFVHVVPYPLPLNRPDVSRKHLLRGLKELAESSALPVRIHLVFARDKQSALRRLIPPGALVLLATKRRWWRTAEETLARVLMRDGHRVILLTLDAGKPVSCGNELRVLSASPCSTGGKGN
jgi:nucleotide-binding universal stress UspA family protein